MAFIAPTSLAVAYLDEEFARTQPHVRAEIEFADSDVTRTRLDSVACGEAVYEFRNPVDVVFIPQRYPRLGEYFVAGFESIVGRGKTLSEAALNWRELLHITFQTLVAKRPFEMNAQDKAHWQLMTDQIDVQKYHRSTPLKYKRFGVVHDARPGHQEIRWIDGSTDRVNLGMMPPDFATYKAGQPFEAVVECDSETMSLLKVDYVGRRSNLPNPTPAAIDALVQKMRSSDEATSTSW